MCVAPLLALQGAALLRRWPEAASPPAPAPGEAPFSVAAAALPSEAGETSLEAAPGSRRRTPGGRNDGLRLTKPGLPRRRRTAETERPRLPSAGRAPPREQQRSGQRPW